MAGPSLSAAYACLKMNRDKIAMNSFEFDVMVKRIIDLRQFGLAEPMRILLRKQAEQLLKDGLITQEEYDFLVRMSKDDNLLPPPKNDRKIDYEP